MEDDVVHLLTTRSLSVARAVFESGALVLSDPLDVLSISLRLSVSMYDPNYLPHCPSFETGWRGSEPLPYSPTGHARPILRGSFRGKCVPSLKREGLRPNHVRYRALPGIHVPVPAYLALHPYPQ